MFINVPDVGRIHIARTGPRHRAPLVFLHPVGLDLTWWDHQFEALGRERDVVAFDMPGHGLSAAFEGALSFDILDRVLNCVIESLGSGPVHLVGLSIGGMIAQWAALRQPDAVQSLCLVATLCTFPDEVRAALRERARVARTEGMARIAALSNERWFTPEFRARRPDILARAERSLCQQAGAFHASIWDMISGLDLEAKLGAVSCPTLVLTGERDINAPPSAAERIAHAIPGAALAIMRGVGHFPPFEEPAGFNQALGSFIDGVEASVLHASR